MRKNACSFKLRAVLRIEKVESPRDFTGNFHVCNLICADRHVERGTGCAVKQDIRGLQQRIAEEAEHCEIFFLQILNLVLVRRDALQPAERCHHSQQAKQLTMLFDMALHEDGALLRVEPGRQPVERNIAREFRNA